MKTNSKYSYKCLKHNDRTEVVMAFDMGNDNIKEFFGCARYRDGDIYDEQLAEKVASAKCWRAYWHAQKMASLARSRELERLMNEEIDKAASFNKKEQELDEYIRRITS